MAYLLKHLNTFICVENNSKQGLFCQFYNEFGFSRPIQVHPSSTPYYSAAIDQNGNPHIVYLSGRSQISYFTFENNRYIKKIILDGSKGNYQFTNFSLQYLDSKMYFFYISNKPNSSSYVVLRQILNEPSETVALFETDEFCQDFRFFTINEHIYLFYISHLQGYTLKCMRIDDLSEPVSVITSDFPIQHYSVCGTNNTLHIAYTKACYGSFQLICHTMQKGIETVICTLTNPSQPSLFNYHNSLWLTYMENQKLYTALSVDQGISFSMPIACSLQENLSNYLFLSSSKYSLSATNLYASVSNYIRLPVIASMDVENIHPNAKQNIELELFLEGFYLLSTQYASASQLSLELASQKQEYELLLKKYEEAQKIIQANHLSLSTAVSEAVKVTDIKSAASAFMNEIHNFDAIPNI